MQLSTTEIQDYESDQTFKVWVSDEVAFSDRLRAKEDGAFKMLYHKYASAIYGNILRAFVDQDKAEVILENVFIEVWYSIPAYDENKIKLFTWINQIAAKHINLSKANS